jgi:hypothetical protein
MGDPAMNGFRSVGRDWQANFDFIFAKLDGCCNFRGSPGVFCQRSVVDFVFDSH